MRSSPPSLPISGRPTCLLLLGCPARPINTSLATARVTPTSPDQVCLPAPLVDASLSVVLELSPSQHHCNHHRHRRHHQHQHQTSTSCSEKTTRMLDVGECASSLLLMRCVLFAGISIPSQNIAMFSPPSPNRAALAHWRRKNNYAYFSAGRECRNLQRSGQK